MQPRRVLIVVGALLAVTACGRGAGHAAAPSAPATSSVAVATTGSTQGPGTTSPTVPPTNASPPGTTLREAGTSVGGIPIVAHTVGNGPEHMLLIGTVHGDEPEGIPLMTTFLAELTASPALLAGRTITIIVNANPDGVAAGTRTNAHGVDLNRNFPAKNWKAMDDPARGSSGTRPLSEPEAATIASVVGEVHPARILVGHATKGNALVNYDGPGVQLARVLAAQNGYTASDTIGYPTPGSFGSWAGNDQQIPIITLEMPRGTSPAAAWAANAAALRAFVTFSG